MSSFLAQLVLVSASLVQPSLVAMQRNAPVPDLTPLRSTDPIERMKAFEALIKIPATLTRADFPTMLVDLLDRENHVLETTLRESKGNVGASDKYGEGYAEYYSHVHDMCNKRCDKRDPRTIRVLASGAYNAGSPFAQELIRDHGREVLPLFLDEASSDIEVVRMDAVTRLGRVAMGRPDLTVEERGRIRNKLIEATRDNSGGVRFAAVETLGTVGTPEDVAVLERLAAQDNAIVPLRGIQSFPVRDAARKSLEQIRQRNPK